MLFSRKNKVDNVDSSDQRNDGEENLGTSRQIGGAAVAGGLVGAVLLGPVVGVLAAGGAAIAATTKSQAGEVARASGTAMAGVGDELKRFDQKHHVVDKTTQGIVKGANWVSKKMDDRSRASMSEQKE